MGKMQNAAHLPAALPLALRARGRAEAQPIAIEAIGGARRSRRSFGNPAPWFAPPGHQPARSAAIASATRRPSMAALVMPPA